MPKTSLTIDELNQFSKTYLTLESKAFDIMRIYGYGLWLLEGINVEIVNDDPMVNINISIHLSGCGSEDDRLTFHLHEMGNDLDYFKAKYEEMVEAKEVAKALAKQKEIEEKRLREESKDRTDYERLKKKFGN